MVWGYGWKAFRDFFVLHSIPIGAAIALVVINIRGHYYTYDATWIPALQFVAKVHELLMQVSIVAVMVGYLQRLLTGRRPVPFGAIFSPYQVTQMSYLWSPEFRAAVTASGWPVVVKVPFLLFVAFSILLAAAVGPSSAIAMQPRPANFTLSNSAVALNVTSDIIYPAVLHSTNFSSVNPTDDPSPYDEHFTETSPASGWEYLAYLPPLEDSQGGVQVKYVQGNSDFVPNDQREVVMPDVYSSQMATYTPWAGNLYSDVEVTRSIYVQYAPNSTIVTVQHVPVALALRQGIDMYAQELLEGPGKPGMTEGVTPIVIDARIDMPQAFASAYCVMNTITDEYDENPINFPTSYIAGCHGDDCPQAGVPTDHLNPPPATVAYTAISRREILEQARRKPEGRIIWIDDVAVTSPVNGTALGAIVVQGDFCGANQTNLTTSACVVGAQWANTSTYMQTIPGSTMYTGLVAQNLLSPEDLVTLPRWTQQPSISMSKAWAEQGLNPTTSINNRTVADILLGQLPLTSYICPVGGQFLPNSYQQDTAITHSPNGWGRPFLHERLIAALVANGLSHAAGVVELWTPAGGGTWSFTRPNDNSGQNFSFLKQPNPPGMVLTMHGYLPGTYAWIIDGVTIKLALAILCAYCAYALAYALYSFSTLKASDAWSSISGLTALAMNSTPSAELENTGAGIRQTATFRKLLSVRETETEGEGRLELVFKRDEDDERKGPYKRVVRGKKYS